MCFRDSLCKPITVLAFIPVLENLLKENRIFVKSDEQTVVHLSTDIKTMDLLDTQRPSLRNDTWLSFHLTLKQIWNSVFSYGHNISCETLT
jgi:hypothetical protein